MQYFFEKIQSNYETVISFHAQSACQVLVGNHLLIQLSHELTISINSDKYPNEYTKMYYKHRRHSDEG